MRQGQNSKRSRGRGRKVQNATNRSYDSSGPDVKIRGTAAHICEKYQQLARDAQSSGDRVAAENYLQHAEHYYRLLMAAQVGQDVQQRQQNQLGYRPSDEEGDYDSDEQPQAAAPLNGHGPNGQAEAGDVRANGASDADANGSDEETDGEAPKKRQPRRRRPRYQAGEGQSEPRAPSRGRGRSRGTSSSDEDSGDSDSGRSSGGDDSSAEESATA